MRPKTPKHGAMNEPARLLLLAQDPNTDHRELSALASQEDEIIQRALVSNPSTPLETLMQLGEKFPALLLENLVFPLLLLENPTLSTIPTKTLVALAKLPQFPSGLLASIVYRDWEIRAVVSSNPSTPPETLLSLLEENDPDDSICVENNPSTPQEYLRLFQRARRLIIGVTKRVDGKAIREKSDEPPLSLEEMELLFSRGTQSRSWLSRNPNIPAAMMEALFDSCEVELRASLASNQGLPPSLLLKLAADPSVYVASQVAPRPTLPLEGMRRLLSSPVNVLRMDLVRNKALPVEMLEVLALDLDEKVRQRVARVEDLPASIGRRLIDDPSVEVRESLAENKTLPPELLTLLLGDHKREVRQATLENLSTPPDFVQLLRRAGCSKDLKQRAMPDLTLSAKELEVLLQSGPFARSLVALHPNTSEEIRWQLAAQNDTCDWVARSLFTPEKILRHLSCLLDEELRFWVATNTHCPLDVLARLSFDRCAGVRKAVAANPNTPIATLEVLSQDVSAFVRYGLAQNPSTAPALLHRLTIDASPSVSYWADPHP